MNKWILWASPILCVALLTAGFTIESQLADENAFKVTTLDAAVGGTQTARFRITGEEDPARAIFENVDVGIGVTSPTEDLEVAGAVKIGTASGTADGTLRWTGTDFEGRKGGAWESFTSRDALKIQGVDVDSTAPTNDQVLKYDSTAGKWKPQADGGGGGLPSDAWEFVSETVAASATNQIQITGLDGDTDIEYLIRIKMTTTDAASTRTYALRYNNDTGATSYHRTLVGYIAGTGVVGTDQTTSSLGFWSITGNDVELKIDGWFYAASGTDRMANFRTGTSIGACSYMHGHWHNSASNLTSIQFLVTQGNNSIAAGSSIAVWRRKP